MDVHDWINWIKEDDGGDDAQKWQLLREGQTLSCCVNMSNNVGENAQVASLSQIENLTSYLLPTRDPFSRLSTLESCFDCPLPRNCLIVYHLLAISHLPWRPKCWQVLSLEFVAGGISHLLSSSHCAGVLPFFPSPLPHSSRSCMRMLMMVAACFIYQQVKSLSPWFYWDI